jgi:hypothetical protein
VLKLPVSLFVVLSIQLRAKTNGNMYNEVGHGEFNFLSSAALSFTGLLNKSQDVLNNFALYADELLRKRLRVYFKGYLRFIKVGSMYIN